MVRALMIQGTASDVGKSLLVAGLARALARRGLSVRPFKAQTISNNAAVTPGGDEIGRAQALQARAAFCVPHADMNPVLIKPEANGAQVVIQGQRAGDVRGLAPERLSTAIGDSLMRLVGDLDAETGLVLIEGSGSAAEANLRARDLANMGLARRYDLPVVVVGSIETGGVIAQLVGTHAVLDPADRRQVVGVLINKFRGDPMAFGEGMEIITAWTGWTGLGVVPWFKAALRLPAEDATQAALTALSGGQGPVRIVVPQLPWIANFDDLDPLRAAPDVRLDLVAPGCALPGDVDLVLLPGSKATRADLAAFRAEGWDIDLRGHWRRGGRILGLCGGYQMLGRSITDPDGIEGPPGSSEGLGYLDVETVLTPVKTVRQVRATTSGGIMAEGYEIHSGATTGPDCTPGWIHDGMRSLGAQSADGRVQGTYLHGLFASDGVRAQWLAQLGGRDAGPAYDKSVEDTLDALARHLEAHVNIDGLLGLARPIVCRAP